MAGKRNRIFALLVPCLTVAVCLIVAEGLLRTLPVYRGLQTQDVTDEQPVFRFQAHREYHWSIGWRFLNPTRGRTNNAGFVNDQDYDADGPGPLLAIIGDSYVEALMVPHKDTLQGRLQQRVDGIGRVYSFAASGAPLSQYLAWARHARDTYRPDGLVIVVVGNDFDESLATFKQGPGFHHFVETEYGELELRLVPFRRGLASKLGSRSAMFWYLINHLHAQTALTKLIAQAGAVFADRDSPKEPAAPEFVGNTAAAANEERLRVSKRAVDAFLERLPEESGLVPDRIVIVMDAIRGSIYHPESAAANEASYFGQMRHYLAEKSSAIGVTVVDLTVPMTDAFNRDGRKFEWQFDSHWDGHGHEIAAEAVAGTPLFESLFGNND